MQGFTSRNYEIQENKSKSDRYDFAVNEGKSLLNDQFSLTTILSIIIIIILKL